MLKALVLLALLLARRHRACPRWRAAEVWQISGYLGIWSYLPSGADFWAHSRAILPRAPRQENLLRREAPSVLGPPQAPKYLASETLGAFLHGKSGVPKDISRTTTSRTTARNIPMPHPGAYVASDRETCVCAFKAFHASTCHSTAGISQNYDSLTDISQTTSASGGSLRPASASP